MAKPPKISKYPLFAALLILVAGVALGGLPGPAGNFNAPFANRTPVDFSPVLGILILLGMMGGILYLGMKRI